MGSSFITAVEIYQEPYESSGVPPIFLFLSFGLVTLSTAIPVISRKLQAKKNSRSIDDVTKMDESMWNKLESKEEAGLDNIDTYKKDQVLIEKFVEVIL